MSNTFKVGDHVAWNSEASRVSGTIIKIHMWDFDYKGNTHHASKEIPQYEIKSDKTDHIAVHKPKNDDQLDLWSSFAREAETLGRTRLFSFVIEVPDGKTIAVGMTLGTMRLRPCTHNG